MKFKIGEKKIIFRGKHLTIWSTDFLDKDGKPGSWEYVGKNDVVMVLPITKEGNVILEKIYRVPLEQYVIEAPAGLMDKDGEEPETAARRELLEETGYIADKIHAIPAWPYRTGTSKNKVYGFIATGLTKVNDDRGDETEDIELLEVRLKDLAKFWLELKDGVLFQPEIVAMYDAAIAMGILS